MPAALSPRRAGNMQHQLDTCFSYSQVETSLICLVAGHRRRPFQGLDCFPSLKYGDCGFSSHLGPGFTSVCVFVCVGIILRSLEALLWADPSSKDPTEYLKKIIISEVNFELEQGV